ncbi:MAG: hypothetical protein KGZ74_15125 [Chitinophagaceae bacterium]|nr:hypothetical protein [Chitinophagaceae bacterium]
MNRIHRVRRELAFLFMAILFAENYAVAKIYTASTLFYKSAERQRLFLPYTSNASNNTFFTNTAIQSSVTAAPQIKKEKLLKSSPDIGGPGQPEMQSFQPTGSSNMVDLFTGDFSYNIPLMDVGGYPVNIHYNSGISMDQEASWVGLGWNINPGTINRNMRGLPDDFNGMDSVTKTLNMKKNVTVGVTFDFNPEILGKEIKFPKYNTTVEYNNYTGIGIGVGVSPTINSGKASLGKMTASVDMNLNLSLSSKGGVDFNPSFSVATYKRDGAITYDNNAGVGFGYNSRRGLSDLTLSASGKKSLEGILFRQQLKIPLSSWGGGSTTISFGRTAFTPSIEIPYTSMQFSFRGKLGGEIFVFHPLGAIGGHYAEQTIAFNDRVQKLPAFGFLNYQEANNKQEVVLDYNRENDNPYSKDIPHIGIPVYTPDVFSVTGEGIGGTFRAYRGDVGYIRDARMKTKSNTGSAAFDFGAGNLFHAGIDLTYNHSYTETREWDRENSLKNAIQFRNADTTFEPSYFRNPAEKTVNSAAYNKAVGGDDLVRVNLGSGLINPQVTNTISRYNENKNISGSETIKYSTVKNERDKRAQVFTYLSAKEAYAAGLDTSIYIHPVNKFIIGKCDPNNTGADTIVREPRINSFRKGHHISEVTVLNPDGKRYIYGIPVYNLNQTEVTFAVHRDSGNIQTGLAGFSGTDNSTNNTRGKDRFFSRQDMPAYAHSYLLTGLLSSDYVDVTGNGVTEDDIGDAVKFNYSRIFGNANPYKWRTPFNLNKASLNEGLRTDYSDDKGHYIYGEKEIWYLHSIESKTMVATFVLNDTLVSKRKDAYESLGENGGVSNVRTLRYLKKINLYTKADYIKNGANAKPVKTVHFEYTYELVPGNPFNSGQAELNAQGQNINANAGKLTLKKIWFTYNGNNKGSKNPYTFYYHTNNPSYNVRNSDRWGNYKSNTQNPSAMLNSEYPYAVQDSTTAATNSSAWVLQSIKLPSGAVIKVDYESDDYAFVQNRRTLQMFKVAGFSGSSSATWNSLSNQLYSGSSQYLYMFVSLTKNVANKQEFYNAYLKDLPDHKLYFKMPVQMPTDTYGSGYEFISAYCTWEAFDLVSGSTNKAWIKLNTVKGLNPVAKTALQFLRLNLPSKAYPGSDVKDDAAPLAVIKVLNSFAPSLKQTLFGFDSYAMLKGWGKNIDTTRSFVRLANPVYKKHGGGLRVKRVLIYDNWNVMTGQKESYYGQEYNYTRTEEIDGNKIIISSGVATYEPTIGNDENPFHVPMEYAEQSSILAPTYGKYIDNPIGESFYPAASVGYSKIRVSSVHRKNAKSATGFEETEFFTAKDFPVYSDFTPFDRSSKRQFRSPLRFFLKIDLRHHLTMSQGFRVELNDMHGKMKSQATYPENDTLGPISYTKNFYITQTSTAKPRLSNTVSVLDKANGAVLTNMEIAKDVEMMFDMREQQSETFGVNVEFNKDMFVIPAVIPIFLKIPSWIPVPNHDLKRFRSVTVMKIVNRYGILDSVVHFEKGSKISTKNLVYDGETGDVVVARTQNEFDDPVYSFSYPTYQAYDALGLAYKNINAVFKNQNLNDGLLTNALNEKFFADGDEVLVEAKEGDRLCTNGFFNYSTDRRTIKLWAVKGTKIGKPYGLYFMDRNGKMFTGSEVTIKIIRSGRRNLLGEAGSITSLNNPIVPFGQGFKIQLDNSTNILNANAVEYKENWKVENRFGVFDSILVYKNPPDLISQTFFATDCYRMKRDNLSNIDWNYTGNFSSTFETRYRYDNQSRDVRSWLKFNLPDSLSNKQIVSAQLILNSHKDLHTYHNSSDPIHHSTNPHHSLNWPSGNSNASKVVRYAGSWMNNSSMSSGQLLGIFNGNGLDWNNNATLVPTTPNPGQSDQNDVADVTAIVNTMVQQIATEPNQVFHLRLDAQLAQNDEWNRRCYSSNINGDNPLCGTQEPLPSPSELVSNAPGDCRTRLEITYLGCYNGNGTLTYLNDGPSGPGYYCYRQDTISFCHSLVTQKSSNPYIMGYLGNWRPYRSYVYYDERKETDLVNTNIRTEGTFKTFSSFWTFGANGITASYDSTKWVWNSEMTKFNRKGMELENKDPLGRYNAGLYGYNQTLPVAVAQNSQYKEIAFDGFEDYGYQNDVCAVPCPEKQTRHLNFNPSISNRLSTVEKHSGKYSLLLNENTYISTYSELPNGSIYYHIELSKQKFDTLNPVSYVSTDTTKVIVNPNQTDKYCYSAVHTDSSALLPRYSPVPGSKIVVGAWVKEAKDCNCESYTENSIEVEFRNAAQAVIGTFVLKPSGNIIEGWQRIDQVVTVPAAAAYYEVRLKASVNSATYFDDLRIQPFNSNMKTFVYNPVNLRLMAELDENNYATFYEYDDEGTLIRVKKETVQGIKTIKETRSALIKQ